MKENQQIVELEKSVEDGRFLTVLFVSNMF